MYIKELSNKEFSDFTNTFPIKSIYQTTEYAFVMSKQNYDSMLIGLIDNGNIVAATLILIKTENGFKYAYAPRGFLLDYNDTNLVTVFTKEIKKFLNKKGIIAIKLSPMIIRNVLDFKNQKTIKNENYDKIYSHLKKLDYYHLGYNNFFEAIKPRFEAIIDISKPIPLLFKNVRKEFKTKIRSAIKCGIEIHRGTIDNINYLYEQTKNKYPRSLDYFENCFNYFSSNNMIDYFYTKINTENYLKYIQQKLAEYELESHKLNAAVINSVGKDNTSLINKKMNTDKYLDKYKNELIKATEMLRDYPEGIITSTILIIKQNKQVSILIDAHDPKYSRFNSKHLLIWQLMQKYAKEGYKTFNLGGLSNVIVDTKKYTGLNEFKLSFGSVVYEYVGDLELITNKHGYNMYRNYVPIKNLIKSKLNK